MIEAPQVVVDEAEQTILVWRRVIIVVMRATPKGAHIDALGNEVYRLGSAGKVALVHLVHIAGAMAPPEESARRRYTELMYDLATPVCCSSVVLEREGFGAAIVRSIIAGLALVTRAKFPTRVFASPVEATAWAVEQLAAVGHACGDADELLAAVRQADARPVPT